MLYSITLSALPESRLIMPNRHLRQEIIDAGVWEDGHVILASGRHSDVKLYMNRLLEISNYRRFRRVMAGMSMIIPRQDFDLMVPVPNGGLDLAHEVEDPRKFPKQLPGSKTPDGEFEFTHPAASKMLGRAASILIFDDVVTTGGTPLKMAETLREINPEAELALAAIWRRDELVSRADEVFSSQFYLIEETIPSWPAENCRDCPLAY